MCFNAGFVVEGSHFQVPILSRPYCSHSLFEAPIELRRCWIGGASGIEARRRFKGNLDPPSTLYSTLRTHYFETKIPLFEVRGRFKISSIAPSAPPVPPRPHQALWTLEAPQRQGWLLFSADGFYTVFMSFIRGF